MNFRNVVADDLERLIQLENEGFTKEEAATTKALKQRIEIIPDTFIVAEENNQIVGYINGPAISNKCITDDLFASIRPNPNMGDYLSVLGLVVAKDFQHQGIAGQLLNNFENIARQHACFGVTLTCRDTLVSFYESHGYINKGLSDSNHANVAWYNLVKEL